MTHHDHSWVAHARLHSNAVVRSLISMLSFAARARRQVALPQSARLFATISTPPRFGAVPQATTAGGHRTRPGRHAIMPIEG